jgi:chaperonin GroES
MSKQSAKTKIIPLGDRVLVKPFTEEDLRKAQGAKAMKFILPESMTKEKSAQGKVLAVGEGKFIDGNFRKPKVNVGDIVLFSKYSYDEVEHGGEELYLLKEENLLAVIK